MSSVDTRMLESSRRKVVTSSHTQLKHRSLQKKAPDQHIKKSSAEYRDSLPCIQVNRKDISVWSILKSCVGKDLSKITFPVVLNEPISMIQRLCEYMEYSFLLDQAAHADNPIDRIEYVCGFVTSALSSNWMRYGKPFNALLGETYECIRPDMGFKFVGEQVSHHPPVTAFHVEGTGYEFHGSIAPGLSFWGKSVDVTPKGTLTVELSKYSETYSWRSVNCYVHNILFGEMWIELCGTVNVTCNKSEMNATLSFKQAGWYSKDLHFVEGHIFNGKKLEKVLYGSWVKGMYSCKPEAYQQFKEDSKLKTKLLNNMKKDANQSLADNAGLPVLTYNFEIPNQRVIWQANPKLLHAKDYYNFSLFTMMLNQMPENNSSHPLPPTDSRKRPDQRLFENGRSSEAEAMKLRVEAKQRDRRNGEAKPLWFKWGRLPSTGKEDWIFDKAYWGRNWSKCPDIFNV